LKDSMDMQRQQKTSYEGSSAKNKMESKGMHRAPSISSASEKEASSATSDNLMDRVLSRDNLLLALKRVERNKGSHGVDGMKVDELRPFLKHNWLTTKESILTGKYKPNAVRRVEIPKPGKAHRISEEL